MRNFIDKVSAKYNIQANINNQKQRVGVYIIFPHENQLWEESPKKLQPLRDHFSLLEKKLLPMATPRASLLLYKMPSLFSNPQTLPSFYFNAKTKKPKDKLASFLLLPKPKENRQLFYSFFLAPPSHSSDQLSLLLTLRWTFGFSMGPCIYPRLFPLSGFKAKFFCLQPGHSPNSIYFS